jgi:hypothetical protein
MFFFAAFLVLPISSQGYNELITSSDPAAHARSKTFVALHRPLAERMSQARLGKAFDQLAKNALIDSAQFV